MLQVLLTVRAADDSSKYTSDSIHFAQDLFEFASSIVFFEGEPLSSEIKNTTEFFSLEQM